jgi:serine/threonine protein phosphatase PrpC
LDDGFNPDPQYGFFAVLDGHGGPEIANFVSKNMPKVFK